jgi:hypothetical protein
MVRRLLFASLLAMVGFAVQAEQTDQAEFAVTAEADSTEAVMRHAVMQETCTAGEWGYDEVRADCRVRVREAPKPNPALKGICTIYYGVRTCYLRREQ